MALDEQVSFLQSYNGGLEMNKKNLRDAGGILTMFFAAILMSVNHNVAYENRIPSLIIIGLFAIGGWTLFSGRKTRIESEERERCLAYTKTVTNITTFWDRESTLFNNTLVKYLDSITENPMAASEACKAANRLVQAAQEVFHRHEAIQPIPNAALGMRCHYSTFFISLKEWAENNLASIEALANGLTPQYEYVQHLMEKRESAWHEALDEEKKLLKQLGLTAPEIEAILRQVHSSLEAAKDDSWQPEPCTYEMSNSAK